MSEEWFYAQDGNEFGPFSSAQLKRLGAAGQIRPTDQVWKAGMAKRVLARAVKGLCPAPVPAGQPQGAAARTTSRPVAPAPEEPVELIAVEPAPAPTQAVMSAAASTQVEDTVELTAVEAPALPAAVVTPAPAFPTPPTAPPAYQVPVSTRVRQPEPRPAFVTDEGGEERDRRKYSGGGRLWVWLLLGGITVLVLGAVVTVLVVALNASKVTPENWAKVKTGMTESEVIRILGDPEFHLTLGNTKTMTWRNGNNVYNVTLQNGQVRALSSGQSDGDVPNFRAPPANPGRINFPGP